MTAALRKKIALALILAVFLAGAACQLARIAADVREPMQLDYGESIVLWQASQVFDLKSAFHPLQQYPYIVFHYPPLYHVVVNLLSRVLGDPLETGRLVSAISGLWLVGVLAWTVFRATSRYARPAMRAFAAALTCALALQVPSMQWLPFARVDMLGLALQFTALSILILGRYTLRNQIGAFALLLLGLYTKQSLLAIPAAAIVLLGLIRPARAVRVAVSFGLAGLSLLTAFALATKGEVLRHWILYNADAFSLIHAVRREVLASEDLAALAATGLATFWMVFPIDRIPTRLLGSSLRRAGVAFGLLATIGFALSWGIGKEGAAINYCLDWQLALCPLTGIFLVYLMRQRISPLWLVAMLGIVATGFQFDFWSMRSLDKAVGWTATARTELAERRREEAALVTLVAGFPGPVVSSNMMILRLANKPIPFEPAIINQTTRTGAFNEEELVQRTANRYFDAFVTPKIAEGFFSRRMLQTILQNYQPYPFRGADYVVYVRQAR